MRTGFKWSLALLFCLYAVVSEGVERLGGISDDTAPPIAQPETPASDPQGKIIYRVICSPDGEQLPDCAQPPVDDTFKAAQPRLAEPENAEAPGSDEAVDRLLEQSEQEGKAAAVEPRAAKKAVKHKKRAKKTTKKGARKKAKTAKKRKSR